MTGLFKRKPKRYFKFKNDLEKLKKMNLGSIGVTMYKNGQVLMQIGMSKHFVDKGLKMDNDSELCLLIFFNKNKTETWNEFEQIKQSDLLNEFLYFEEPKGIHNYVKSIGLDSNEIEKYVNMIADKLFNIQSGDKLGIDFRAE